MSQPLPSLSNETTVSVIIPFYNREKFLAETVESVLGQTYQNWELILIDDGSIDDSWSIAQKFVHQYPKQIFLYAHKNRENRGASSSRNLGVKHATGEFITFLDSDDVFLPDTLEIEIKALRENDAADVVCGTLQYWFSWSEKASKKERDFTVNLDLEAGKLYEPPSLLIHNLRAGGRKPGMGCVILRSDFTRKIALFEDDFVFVSEDQIFWAKVSLHAKIFILEHCLVKYRQHPHSSSALLFENGDVNENWNRFSVWLEDYLRANKIENRELRQALEGWHRENSFRVKFKRIVSLYQRFFPYHIRYRIRDCIIRWRMRK